jgi:hypothetical protein
LRLEAWTRPRDLKDGAGKPTGERKSAIERLHIRLCVIHSAKSTSNFKDESAVRNWAEVWSQEFAKHGVTPQMALEAVERCVIEFTGRPPSLPEFIALCRPSMDYEAAFLFAVSQMHKRHDGEHDDYWPQPAVYRAAVDFGQFNLRNSSYGQSAA